MFLLTDYYFVYTIILEWREQQKPKKWFIESFKNEGSVGSEQSAERDTMLLQDQQDQTTSEDTATSTQTTYRIDLPFLPVLIQQWIFNDNYHKLITWSSSSKKLHN